VISNGRNVMDALPTLSFDGASGPVMFDTTGDRSISSIAYGVKSYQDVGGVMEANFVRIVQGGVFTKTGEVVWRDGHPVQDITLSKIECPSGYVIEYLQSGAKRCSRARLLPDCVSCVHVVCWHRVPPRSCVCCARVCADATVLLPTSPRAPKCASLALMC
jgi:hypothetical protein